MDIIEYFNEKLKDCVEILEALMTADLTREAWEKVFKAIEKVK